MLPPSPADPHKAPIDQSEGPRTHPAFPRDWQAGGAACKGRQDSGPAMTRPCLCPAQVSAAGDGMDEAEQDQHEARLKELFDSFDTTGTGSLGQEELTDLCHMLSLEEVAPVLQETLLQDNLLGRVRPAERPAVGSGCGVCRGWGGAAEVEAAVAAA